jgi:hypothetical protein
VLVKFKEHRLVAGIAVAEIGGFMHPVGGLLRVRIGANR